MSISSMHSMHTTNSESKDEYRSVRSSTSSQTFRDPVNGSRKGTKETVLLNSEETIPQTKQRIYFSCPPQGLLNKVMTNGNEVLPNGSLFGLVIIFYSACVGGILLQLIRIPPVPPLPPLLGMLLAGFIIRNIPSIAKHVKVPTWWSSTLRSTALTVILIRAGLGLDPKVLQQMKTVCFRLSFGPCLVEACSAAVFSHFIMDFPWQWGFLLGFVLGAVSPAVVVPSMLRLQEAGYGAEKGIPTLLVAASSMDDIVAITGFNTFLNLIFSKGCPRSPGSGDSSAHGTPLGVLCKGRDDSGIFSHPGHSPKRGTVHRHPGAQVPHTPLGPQQGETAPASARGSLKVAAISPLLSQ